MTEHEKEIVLHIMKEIAVKQRQHIEWVNGRFDSMFKMLNIEIPERRIENRRKSDEQRSF